MLGAVQQIVSQKICAKCGYSKSLDRFPRNISNIDGIYSYCKECASSNSMLWGY